MTKGRAAKLAAVAAVAAVGMMAGVGLSALSDRGDPTDEIGVVSVSEDAPSTSATSDTTGGSAPGPADGRGTSRAVAGLEEVRGTVRADEGADVADDLTVAGVELEFGPDRWVETATAAEDYDGDGATELLRVELTGLIGSEADFRVRLDDDGDEGEVYVINGLGFREAAAPPPWVRTPPKVHAASEDEVRRAAAEAVGEGATVTALEFDDDGRVAWEAEVVDASGREYEVELNASGHVLDVDRD
ncbi:MAG: PepSY domain-containing protein [Acidimicrobiia bacterium]